MKLSLLLSLLLFVIAAYMSFTWWQQANVRVRQQALQMRINSFKNEGYERQEPFTAEEEEIRQQRLDDMQRELNSLRARDGAR
jgi:hypothetical protein